MAVGITCAHHTTTVLLCASPPGSRMQLVRERRQRRYCVPEVRHTSSVCPAATRWPAAAAPLFWKVDVAFCGDHSLLIDAQLLASRKSRLIVEVERPQTQINKTYDSEITVSDFDFNCDIIGHNSPPNSTQQDTKTYN